MIFQKNIGEGAVSAGLRGNPKEHRGGEIFERHFLWDDLKYFRVLY